MVSTRLKILRQFILKRLPTCWQQPMKIWGANMLAPPPRFVAKATAAVVSTLGVGLWFQQNFKIGLDNQINPCLEARLFLIERHPPKEFQVGQLYVFVRYVRGLKPPYRLYPKTWLKRLAAKEGDRVILDEQGAFFVNGIKLRNTLPLLENSGKSIRDFRLNRVLQPGELFFLGDTENSYDSRYWGIVTQAEVKGQAWKLW